MGPERVTEVASRLASELVTLHAKVSAHPYFPLPSESTGDLVSRLPEIVDMTQHHSGLPVPRNSRAVSLPPNPELIHSRPEQGETREQKNPVEAQPLGNGHPTEEIRAFGDGIPQFQPYW